MKKQYSKTGCKVTFSLPKVAIAESSSVVLLGDFNDWDRAGIPLKANGETYYTEVELEAGKEYEFRYLINNERWENDWNADKYVPSPYEGILNSVVAVPVAPAMTAAPKKASKKVTLKVAKPTVKKAAVAKPVAKKAVVAKPAAKKAAKPKKAVKDNLKKIEGIGPKISQVLTAAGVATFKELAATKPARIREILIAENPKYRMYDPTTWPEQADLAAKGEWEKLQVLQDILDGGKRK